MDEIMIHGASKSGNFEALSWIEAFGCASQHFAEDDGRRQKQRRPPEKQGGRYTDSGEGAGRSALNDTQLVRGELQRMQRRGGTQARVPAP